MTTMIPIITCPVCEASGSMIHHDIRSSLVYSCLNCTHEWQIDPVVEAGATNPTVEAATTQPRVIEHPRTSSRTKRPRPRKF